MISPQQIADVVATVVPDASVHPTDLNGGGDHWHVVIVSPAFEGKRSFQRQRPILAAFTPHIQSGIIHALDIKCMTPDEVQETGGGLPEPFVPHREGEGMHPASWD